MKTVTRHIWKDYEELADDARYTPIYQRMYKARKETIERVFADAKEQHGLRYTRYTGLAQVTNWVKLKFAAMNLKKYAKWVWRDTYPDCFSCITSLVSHFSKQTPVLLDAELGFIDTLRGQAHRLTPTFIIEPIQIGIPFRGPFLICTQFSGHRYLN